MKLRVFSAALLILMSLNQNSLNKTFRIISRSSHFILSVSVRNRLFESGCMIKGSMLKAYKSVLLKDNTVISNTIQK